jgi:hypothetical protein
MSRRTLLLAAALALFGCAPSPQILESGRVPCLRFNVFDQVTGNEIRNALVTIDAEFGRRSAIFIDIDYPTMFGCRGTFTVIVECPGYERYEATHRSFSDRDFSINRQSQHIIIRLRPRATRE